MPPEGILGDATDCVATDCVATDQTNSRSPTSTSGQ
jgi:hypothetical protein